MDDFEAGQQHHAHGFTLLELMIVLVILGILATQVVTGWNSPVSKLKTAAFNMRTDFSYARGEAAKRNEEVGIVFIFNSADLDGDGDNDNGYLIWVDSDSDGVVDGGETVLKQVPFRDEVLFYDRTVPEPDGPMHETDNSTALVVGTGVSFAPGWFCMRSDGTSNIAGTVYLYAPNQAVLAANPATAAPDVIGAGPFAVVVSNVGRVHLRRWRSGSWERK